MDLSDQFVQLLVFVVQDNVNEYLKVNSVEPFVQYFEEGRPKSEEKIYIHKFLNTAENKTSKFAD